MELATPQAWEPVDSRQFQIWLERFDSDEPMGMAGGWTLHAVAFYLNHRDGGQWCLEVTREYVRLLNRSELHPSFQIQRGWLLDFCWELRRSDAHRNVTAVDCLAALVRALGDLVWR